MKTATLALATVTAVLAVSALWPATAQTSLAPGGPFGAVMEHEPGRSAALTIYRPRDLAGAGALPIVVWANGACRSNGGAGARPFLLELASYGYFVVALGAPGHHPEVEPRRERGAPAPLDPVAPGRDETASADLIAAIDWSIQEDVRAQSIYHGRLDPHAIAVMGHSCGGLQALAVQSDPRIVTTMIWHSGIYDRPAGRIGVRLTKDELRAVTRPIAYIHGGPTDIAFDAARSDFAQLPASTPAVLIGADLGHNGALTQHRGGMAAEIARAWLDWRLKGDVRGAAFFEGPSCGLCANTDWSLTRRNIE